MFDCHVHTKASHDSETEPEELAAAIINKRLEGVTVTDHYDIMVEDRETLLKHRKDSFGIVELAEKCGVTVLKGMEIGEPLDNPGLAEMLAGSPGLDMVMGAVHGFPVDGKKIYYAQIDFGGWPEDRLSRFLDTYFGLYLRTVRTQDIDVAAHLTCPLRYINGKYKRNVGVRKFGGTVEEILGEIIKRKIALEVNTSGLGGFYGELMPEEFIIKRYRELGGRLITLGSDAHKPENIGNGFSETAGVLKRLGFEEAYYYKKRKAVKYSL